MSVGQLYSDLILCKANQILSGSAHPPSLTFQLSSQPQDRIETQAIGNHLFPLANKVVDTQCTEPG